MESCSCRRAVSSSACDESAILFPFVAIRTAVELPLMRAATSRTLSAEQGLSAKVAPSQVVGRSRVDQEGVLHPSPPELVVHFERSYTIAS